MTKCTGARTVPPCYVDVVRVSIIFPAAPDRTELVRRAVLALRGQTADPSLFEVVIAADGGDSKGLLRKAIQPESHPFAVKIVDSPRPHGNVPHRNNSRNAGCRASTGDLLWVWDADFILWS